MTALVFPLLRLLADGRFHSGQTMAGELGCSRAHVWQQIQTIEQELGLTVQHVRGKGYRLTRPLDWLDPAAIGHAGGAGWVIEVAESLPSTNTALLTRATDGAPHKLALFAEAQTAGRGRRGRSWLSSLGGSLTFSLLWRFDCGVSGLSGLSLAIGVAIVRALARLQVPVALKWPNDVLLDGRKLAGILIELSGDTLGPSAVVIGIGVNLAPAGDVGQPSGGVHDVVPGVSRNVLAGALLEELDQVLQGFERDGFSAWQGEWQRWHAHQGLPVTIHKPDGRLIDGIALGVDHTGALRLETGAGEVLFHVGDVSLRAAT